MLMAVAVNFIGGPTFFIIFLHKQATAYSQVSDYQQ